MSSVAGAPARGNTSKFGFAFELEGCIPEYNFRFLRLNPPIDMELNRTEEEDGSVNSTGFAQPMLASQIVGDAAEVSLRVTPGDLLEFFFHLTREVTKSTPEVFINKYVFSGNAIGPDSGFTVYSALPPVEDRLVHTVKFSSIEIPLVTSSAMIAKLAGQVSRDQLYDISVADGSNLGTYPGPKLRGPVKFNGLGSIHVRVADPGASMTYTAEISDIAPTYPGAELPVFRDVITQRGDWSTLQGAIKMPGTVTVVALDTALVGVDTQFTKFIENGNLLNIDGEEIVVQSVTDDNNIVLATAHGAGAAAVVFHLLNQDLGYYDENKDPVEIVFPGDDTDYALAMAADQWSFAEEVTPIDPSFESFGRFNMSHVKHEFKEEGEPDSEYRHFRGVESTLILQWPVEPEIVDGSNYVFALDRIGLFSASLAFSATFRERNSELIRWAEGHRRITARISIEGRKLGTGAFREGIVIDLGSGSLTSAKRPTATVGKIPIATEQMFTTNNDSSISPSVITVHTARDWTPPVFI